MKLTLASGRSLQIEGKPGTGLDPIISGSDRFESNLGLCAAVWEYANEEFLYRRVRNSEKRQAARKRAKAASKKAMRIGKLIDASEPQGEFEAGWCSACLKYSSHEKMSMPRGWSSTSMCKVCSAPTVKCVVPRCENFAVRGLQMVDAPVYCAEHRHEVSSFDKLDAVVDELSDADELLKFEKPNFARGTRLTAGAAAAGVAMTGVGFFAAPLIGGLVGTTASALGTVSTTLYGAAATSHGLALLGGGAVTAGSWGFGMAGGTVVVTVLSGAAGTGLGARLTSAYVSQDKSFKIEKLANGEGVPVVVINGFLSEKDDSGWADWKELVIRKYPDSPVYRVHWGSKELKSLGTFIGGGSMKAAARNFVVGTGKKVSKKLTKVVGPIGTGVVMIDLLKNPWHTAKSRADKTAVVLADLLARTKQENFVLIGHSLGGRIAAKAATILGAKDGAPRVKAVHLLGAAVVNVDDWHHLNEGVSEAAYCYYAPNDAVLKWLFRTVQGGQTALGATGFKMKYPNLKNSKVTVSKGLTGHSEYFEKVRLR